MGTFDSLDPEKTSVSFFIMFESSEVIWSFWLSIVDCLSIPLQI